MTYHPPAAPGTRADTACPFVGLLTDRATRYRLPDHRNGCYAGRRPRPVDLSHQEAFCCSAGYGECPRYRSAVSGSGWRVLRHLLRPVFCARQRPGSLTPGKLERRRWAGGG